MTLISSGVGSGNGRGKRFDHESIAAQCADNPEAQRFPCFKKGRLPYTSYEPPQKHAKTPAILNMYWTDIGLWKLMEIVKNTR